MTSPVPPETSGDQLMAPGVLGLTNDTVTTPPLVLAPLVSDQLRLLVDVIVRAVLGQAVGLCGMVSNVINMCVYVRMGFKDSINVSLFSLALSDFLSCFTQSALCVWYIPWLVDLDLDLPFDPEAVRLVLAGNPHRAFVKATGCITAYIAFERCLCVTFPLRVKNLVTPRRVTCVMAGLWLFALCEYAPIFYMYRLGWNFDPRRNRTVLGLRLSRDRKAIEKWLFIFSGFLSHWVMFGFAFVSTVILVVTLRRKSKWRSKAASSSASSSTNQGEQPMSSRDTKVAKLVVTVCLVFIALFTPFTGTMIAMALEPGIAPGGRYNRLFSVLFSCHDLLETVNASINIFIYYFRSSKYKATFDRMFLRRKMTGD